MKEITLFIRRRARLNLRFFTPFILVSFLLLTSIVNSQNNPISILFGGSVGCQVYASGEPPRDEKEPLFLEDIGDSNCFRICENRIIYYSLQNLPPNSTVVWNAIGGTVQNTTTDGTEVYWGSAGMGSLQIQITTGTTVLNKTLCFEKIIGPRASFEVVPFEPNEQNYILGCIDQTLYFTNTSHANGGSAIVSYHWDFGDGVTSSAENPTHVYTADGYYGIKLTVTNACNCTHTYSLIAEIGKRGFDISCPSIVCEGQRATYS
ncbi:PKD domain-containing protein [Flavobacterium sp.]|uniref:PKD domain-containing protein n=1 Tax=Flavobacterium sp. TaxID=239 RepID=UPI002FD9BBE3